MEKTTSEEALAKYDITNFNDYLWLDLIKH